MPDPKPSNLRLESDPDEYADAIASALAGRPESPEAARQYLASHFGTERLAQAVLHLLPQPTAP